MSNLASAPLGVHAANVTLHEPRAHASDRTLQISMQSWTVAPDARHAEHTAQISTAPGAPFTTHTQARTMSLTPTAALRNPQSTPPPCPPTPSARHYTTPPPLHTPPFAPPAYRRTYRLTPLSLLFILLLLPLLPSSLLTSLALRDCQVIFTIAIAKLFIILCQESIMGTLLRRPPLVCPPLLLGPLSLQWRILCIASLSVPIILP